MIPSLTVLIVSFLFQLTSSIGYSVLAEHIWRIYANSIGKSRVQKLAHLRKELYDLKITISKTSAQDEFAMWAKLRRKYDKLLASYQESSKSLAFTKSSLTMQVSWGLWALFWLAQIIFVGYWMRVPMFYVPPDWVGPFGWYLSAPFAPKGSVSVIYWFSACKVVSNKLFSFIRASLRATHAPAL